MGGIDIIGDVHGHADALVALLSKLGYRERKGVWRHPERTALFVGDFIDRGPSQERVLEIVRSMCEASAADAIMGNHEYNAVCFATPDPEASGEHLRPHTDKNENQHREFLEQFDSLRTWSQSHREWIDWFRTLPLWLERDGLRVVHACWDPASQATLRPWLDAAQRLFEAGFVATSRKGTAEHEAVETVLKGLEIQLPHGATFKDKDGHERDAIRVKWWSSDPMSYRDGALIDDKARKNLPEDPIPWDRLPGYREELPVFVGHYWLEGTPAPQSDRVACVDYSIAKGGKLCAYRWQGEAILRQDRFAWVAMPYTKLQTPGD
ncbi:MAG: metallophosphoesterase [Spiribacter salinus]|uniref:Metallophosphoesterase n=1 Tax=Spiribacter salinus TaxID=1335746 RepID=A0A540VQ44_9GAMM|nr:MAG: metallophosphoesterase [Spiribacter salinus]